MLFVTNVMPLEGHTLRVEFSNGVVGDVDCTFLMGKGLGIDLRDKEYFRRVSLDEDLRTVVWPNGLDPAPEVLYDVMVVVDGASGVPSAA